MESEVGKSGFFPISPGTGSGQQCQPRGRAFPLGPLSWTLHLCGCCPPTARLTTADGQLTALVFSDHRVLKSRHADSHTHTHVHTHEHSHTRTHILSHTHSHTHGTSAPSPHLRAPQQFRLEKERRGWFSPLVLKSPPIGRDTGPANPYSSHPYHHFKAKFAIKDATGPHGLLVARLGRRCLWKDPHTEMPGRPPSPGSLRDESLSALLAWLLTSQAPLHLVPKPL